MFEVIFFTNKDRKRVTKIFDNYRIAYNFVNRAKRSKDITLISYPNFEY